MEFSESAKILLEQQIQKYTDIQQNKGIIIGGALLQIGKNGGKLVNGRYNTERFYEILKIAVESVNGTAELQDPNILLKIDIDKSLDETDHQKLGKALGDVFEVLVFSALAKEIRKALEQGALTEGSGTSILDAETKSTQFLEQQIKVYTGGGKYLNLISGLQEPALAAARNIAQQYFKKGSKIRLTPKAGSSKEGDLILNIEVDGKQIRHVLELKSQFSIDNMITWSTLSDRDNYGGSAPAVGKYSDQFEGPFGSYVRFLMKNNLYAPEGSPDFKPSSSWIQSVTNNDKLTAWMRVVSQKRSALETFRYFLSKGEGTEILSRKSLIVAAHNLGPEKTEVILNLEEAINNFPNTKNNKMKIENRQKGISWKIGNTTIGGFEFEKFGSESAETETPIPGEQVAAKTALWRYTTFKMTVNPRRWRQFQK